MVKSGMRFLLGQRISGEGKKEGVKRKLKCLNCRGMRNLRYALFLRTHTHQKMIMKYRFI